MAQEKELLASVAVSASYNIILQISMRIMTFMMNAVIVHYVSTAVLGVVNVRLMLLYTTMQFLSREPFRRSCLSRSEHQNWRTMINLLWCSIPISVIWGLLLGFVWMYVLTRPDATITPNYTISVISVVISVWIEMIAEPLNVIGQISQFVRLKVLSEGLALTVRCTIMVTLVVFLSATAETAFSIGLLLSSTCYCSLYYVYFMYKITREKFSLPFKKITDIFPNLTSGNELLDFDSVQLTVSFFKQSCLKQLLTEGERYIMTMFNAISFSEQGVYDIVNNLGSLAARFIFQPIEENSYIFFAQSMKRGDTVPYEVGFILQVLEHLLKIMTLLGLIIFSFGLPFADDALYLYGGASLASGLGPYLLKWHSFYVIFLSLNGPTECFTFATMNSKALEAHNRNLVVLSALFLFFSYFFTSLFGSAGFIIANCFNMGVRIGHSLIYIKNYSKISNPLMGLVPNPVVLCLLFSSSVFLLYTGQYLHFSRGMFYILLHSVVGAFCLLAVLISIYVLESNLVSFVKTFLLKRNG